MCETALRARQRGRVARLSALLAAAALCAPAVWAQSVAPPQATSQAARGVVLADVSHPVRQLGVEGVTVFDPTELLHFATALHRDGSGKAFTAQSVAQAMALMYREDGYPLAEVTWRSEPATGSVMWVVHEGHIEQVSLSGLDEATTARTLRYLTPLTRLRKANQPKTKASRPGTISTIAMATGNMSMPCQNHGSSFQFRNTMKSGRMGSP